MDTLFQDLRFALRSFRRAPAFPLAAIATLALGIGATTAIFSTLNAVLLKPLPYPQADSLYNIRTTLTDGRITTGMLSNGELSRLEPVSSIAGAGGLQQNELTLIHGDGTPQLVTVYGVTDGFFELFGLPMTLGGFTHQNFVPPPQPPQAPAGGPPAPPAPPPAPRRRDLVSRVEGPLSGGSRDSSGSRSGSPRSATTIAGVAPQDFDTPHGGDFWFSAQLGKDDINHFFDGYMRLKPGVTLDRANAEMAGVMSGLSRDFPAADQNRVYVTKPLVASVVGDLGPILIIVMSATGLLLLLACVNVTNLLLARGAARGREMALRAALGAPRGRIIRQLLTESTLLSVAGAVCGVLSVHRRERAPCVRRFQAAAPGRRHVRRPGAVVLAGRPGRQRADRWSCAGAPAAGTDVRTLLNESTRSSTGGRGTARWLRAMTVIEIALAIMLVAGAGWLVRGFANLRSTDLGFVAEQRLIFDVSFLGAKYPNGRAVDAASHGLLERLRALPGVAAAAATSNFPLRNTLESFADRAIPRRDGGSPPPDGHPAAHRERGTFQAMGTRLLEGRDFGPDDRLDTRPVALINKSFVKRYLAGRDPIGRPVLCRLSPSRSAQRSDGRRRRG